MKRRSLSRIVSLLLVCVMTAGLFPLLPIADAAVLDKLVETGDETNFMAALPLTNAKLEPSKMDLTIPAVFNSATFTQGSESISPNINKGKVPVNIKNGATVGCIYYEAPSGGGFERSNTSSHYPGTLFTIVFKDAALLSDGTRRDVRQTYSNLWCRSGDSRGNVRRVVLTLGDRYCCESYYYKDSQWNSTDNFGLRFTVKTEVILKEGDPNVSSLLAISDINQPDGGSSTSSGGVSSYTADTAYYTERIRMNYGSRTKAYVPSNSCLSITEDSTETAQNANTLVFLATGTGTDYTTGFATVVNAKDYGLTWSGSWSATRAISDAASISISSRYKTWSGSGSTGTVSDWYYGNFGCSSGNIMITDNTGTEDLITSSVNVPYSNTSTGDFFTTRFSPIGKSVTITAPTAKAGYHRTSFYRSSSAMSATTTGTVISNASTNPSTNTYSYTTAASANWFRADYEPDLGNVTVIKKNTAGAAMSDVEFTLTGTSTAGFEVNLNGTTNANGELSFTNVPVGTFTLTETSTPAGYQAASPREVTVTVNHTTTAPLQADVTNYVLSDVKVIKKSENGNKSLEGASFTLSGAPADGSSFTTVSGTTGLDGSYTFENVPEGTYTLTETSAPTGYCLPSSASQSVTLTSSNAGQTVEYTVYDPIVTGALTLTKVDSVNTGTGLSGAKFTLEGVGDDGTAYSEEAITGTNGQCTFSNIPYSTGTYTLTETTAPSGDYSTTGQTWTVRVSAAGDVTIDGMSGTNSFTITNIKKTTTTVSGTKTWEDGGNTHNNSTEITLTLSRSSNGSAYSSVTATPTWSGNTYTFSNLDKYDANGYLYTYKVTEAPINGYRASYNGFNITNTALTGNVVLTKKDNFGNLLKDATFTLTGTSNIGGSVNLTGTTNANGQIIWNGVQLGTYLLHETSAPAGYQTAADQYVSVTADATISVDVTDNLSLSNSNFVRVYDFGVPITIQTSEILGSIMDVSWQTGAELVGISSTAPATLNSGVTNDLSGFGANITFEDGAQVSLASGKITYSPALSQLVNSVDTVYCKISVTKGYYIYSKVDFLPATNVLYEEDHLTYENAWTAEGSASGALVQSEENVLYGNDTIYAGTANDSVGHAKVTTVSDLDNNHKASFTFTGNGFDIISRCSEDSGTMLVCVFDSNNQRVETVICDCWLNTENESTYYQIPVVHKTDYPYGAYRVEVYAFYNALFDHNISATRSVVTEAKVRQLLNLPKDVPLSIERACSADLSAYKAERKAVRSAAAAGNYKIYLDGVRIYNPLGFTNADCPLNAASSGYKEVAKTAYETASELNPDYVQVRKAIVTGEETDDSGDLDSNGVLYVASKGSFGMDADYTSGAVYLSTSGSTLDYDTDTNTETTVGNSTFFPIKTTTDAGAIYYNVNDSVVVTEAAADCYALYQKKIGEKEEDGETVNVYDKCLYYYDGNEMHAIKDNGKYLFIDNKVDVQGPENEMYLQSGTAIAFQVANYQPGDTVHISLKSPTGTAVSASVNGQAAANVCSKTEVYYNISDFVTNDGIVAITTDAVDSNVLSVCNIKVTGRTPASASARTASVRACSPDKAYNAILGIQTEPDEQPVVTEDFGITSAYLRLNQDINVIYTAKLPENSENPYMIFTMNNIERKVTEYTVNDQGEYCFAFEGVTPQCMGDNISAALYATVNGTQCTDTRSEYSVRTYCANTLARYADNAKVVTLLSDLLAYGSAAQAFTGYKTETMVTDGLALNPSSYQEIAGYGASFSGEDADVASWHAASLTLSNNLAMNLIFKADSVDDLTIHVTVNGRTETFAEDDFNDLGNGKYSISFRGILATEFDDVVSASFYVGENQIGRTLNYSVNAYICSEQNNVSTPNLAALVRALYNYGAAAQAYSE